MSFSNSSAHKEPIMINVTVRTNDNTTRTPAEVKRLLYDIAFALRVSQKIKLEVMSARKHSARPLTISAVGRSIAACAA